MKRLFLVCVCLVCLCACTTQPEERTVSAVPSATRSMSHMKQTAPKQPEELGRVRWLRDFDQAIAQSKAKNKPLFVLFTEVPGCDTVRGFANSVLRHPQVVESIESDFIPVAIYNNIDGKDRQVLKSFGEPTWNNPVVRIMDANRKPLAKRFAGPYNVGAMVRHMLKSYPVSGRKAPEYLKLLGLRTKAPKKAVFSMYCFWSGEAKLGGQGGVIASRTGFANGAEVVEVQYDPKTTNRQTLAKQFGREPLAEGTKVRASLKDDKYQLKHSPWRFVPMTATQASRVNAALGHGKSPRAFLSARQVALYALIRKHPKAPWPNVLGAVDIIKAWQQTQAVAGAL